MCGFVNLHNKQKPDWICGWNVKIKELHSTRKCQAEERERCLRLFKCSKQIKEKEMWRLGVGVIHKLWSLESVLDWTVPQVSVNTKDIK